MAENIKSRKYYRVHNGESWDRMHFVTDANSVDANDGDTMETKVGAFKGITTSTNVTEEGYAADATTVAALNDSLGGLSFGVDSEGNYGYYKYDEPVGADTLVPFKGLANIVDNGSYTIPEGTTKLLCIAFGGSGEGGYPTSIKKPSGDIVVNVESISSYHTTSGYKNILSYSIGGVVPVLYAWIVETNGQSGDISFSINYGGVGCRGNVIFLLN